MNMKRFEDWQKGSFYEFLEVNDQVDKRFYEYFINVLPPVTFWTRLVQMGEPYSHVNGEPTYATLSKEDGVWVYKGHCYKGQSEMPIN